MVTVVLAVTALYVLLATAVGVAFSLSYFDEEDVD